MEIFNQVFKMILFLSGVNLVVLAVFAYNNNLILTTIGGLIIFISGMNVLILFYQKDRSPDEIITKVKKAVRSFNKKESINSYSS